ncbi:hypothetical protein EGR_07708 [Echinococcus granulosus]|uniref:Uncharacterized protein n=1 Tax=Echinococcus granulosus TaxID=6210 RepID=W6UAD2_ECHGR|nr:hypothetical protein EGR_07708 [Echinococcus granulosus]EUB57466.1 hypothetical protein EGR_07708 [Echinococcus granulosus]
MVCESSLHRMRGYVCQAMVQRPLKRTQTPPQLPPQLPPPPPPPPTASTAAYCVNA